MTEPSTTIYRARRVITMDAAGTVEAMAVSTGRVVAVGRPLKPGGNRTTTPVD